MKKIKFLFLWIKNRLPLSSKEFSKYVDIVQENRELVYKNDKSLHELLDVVQKQNIDITLHCRETSEINGNLCHLSERFSAFVEKIDLLSNNIDLIYKNQSLIINNLTNLEYQIKGIGVSNLGNEIEELKKDIHKNEHVITHYKKQIEMMFWELYKKNGERSIDTKKRFFMGLPKASGELRDVQIIEAILLKRLKDICENNNLSYWLWGGSLLGAVRHRGFIPWDDDIDVGMPRCDLKALGDFLEKDPEMILKTKYDSCVNCRQIRMQFRDPKIPAFIDIFPFDYTSEKRECDVENIKNEMIYELLESNQPEVVEYRNKTLTEEETREGLVIKAVFAKYHEKLIESGIISDKCKENIFYGIDNYNPNKTKILPVESFFPLKSESFEGEKYYIPNKSNEILDDIYGDIYSLPDGEPHFDHIDLKNNKKAFNDFLKNQK